MQSCNGVSRMDLLCNLDLFISYSINQLNIKLPSQFPLRNINILSQFHACHTILCNISSTTAPIHSRSHRAAQKKKASHKKRHIFGSRKFQLATIERAESHNLRRKCCFCERMNMHLGILKFSFYSHMCVARGFLCNRFEKDLFIAIAKALHDQIAANFISVVLRE